MEMQKKEVKSNMSNEEKDKKGLYHERERVMAKGTTCNIMKRQLHWLLEKFPNVQINWVECKSHAQANVSINTCFSKCKKSLCDIVLVT